MNSGRTIHLFLSSTFRDFGEVRGLLERQPRLKKHPGCKSITEIEILHGVLSNRRIQDGPR
jgi:hypothetical protein